MFHRVIDAGDPQLAMADPEYAVDGELFDELLGFFQDHYSIVSLTELITAADHDNSLPEYPLLITFDDGWADNLLYAAPRLERRGIPAVIFVVAEALVSSSPTWWQEVIFAAARQGKLASGLDLTALEQSVGKVAHDADPFELVCRLGVLGEKERSALLPLEGFGGSRMMLSPADLPYLHKAGIAVGNHGYTHLPLTRVPDIEKELRKARDTIASFTGDATSASALACPHGRYDDRVLKAAREAGMRLVFTSDPHLNRITRSPIGRISICYNLVNTSGQLDSAAAATWLWRRPCV